MTSSSGCWWPGTTMNQRGFSLTRSYVRTLSSIISVHPRRAHSQRKLTGESSSPGHCPRSIPSLISRNTASLVPTCCWISSSTLTLRRLGVLDHDSLEDVGSPLGRVDRVLEPL